MASLRYQVVALRPAAGLNVLELLSLKTTGEVNKASELLCHW
ncbi:MAG: hypothetical protein U0Z17_02135 [Bacteroidales bacterium]